MHNRQSGAAHVPIMFFLLLLVMFIGAVVFAFTTHTKNGDLIKQRNDAVAEAASLRKKELLLQDYFKAVDGVIRKQGTYEGEKGSGGIYGDATLSTYTGVINPTELKKVMDDALAAAGLSAATGLENVLNALVTKVNATNTRVKEVEAALEVARAEKSEIDKKFQAAAAEASAKASQFRTDLDQARSDFANAGNEREGRITGVTESLRAKNEELSAEKERATAEKKNLEREIAKHQMQSSALIARDALRKPADAADGKILIAKNGIPTAFINLGRKDNLIQGTVFRVKSPSSDKVKGYATVSRVEEERSEVTLSEFVDPIGDYARAGDLLYNDLFSPGFKRTIYLMGRFEKPYAKDDLANLLRRLGNRVVTKMQPGVDTVILGNDPINEAADGFTSVQESPEFKLASELRVEFTYLATIRDLIKL